MKWVKSFLEGVCIAMVGLMGLALVVGIFWACIEVAAWVEAAQVSNASIIAVICAFFVVCFGLLYSFWGGQGEKEL